MPPASELRSLVERCAAAGFDLWGVTTRGRANQGVPSPYALPGHRGGHVDAASDDDVVVMVGNTRALWPAFIAALAQDAELLGASDPLDRYTEQTVGTAAAALATPHVLRYVHAAGEERIAAQRIAVAAGIGALSPGNLCIHPTYGPWIALRAVLVLPSATADAIRTVIAPYLAARPPSRDAFVCTACDAGCAPRFALALATQRSGAQDWKAWLAVRDACPLGREHRYEEAQIAYHYTKDRRILQNEVERLGLSRSHARPGGGSL